MRVALLAGWLQLQRASNTTTWLLVEALRRGHEAWLVDFLTLGLSAEGRVTGHGVRPPATRAPLSRATAVDSLRRGDLEHADLDLSAFDLALLRHDPHDRHSAWGRLLGDPVAPFATALERDGVRVVNRPATAGAWASGVAWAGLPERLRPRTLVSRDEGAVRAFVAALGGPAVLKPLHGSGGLGVFRIEGPRDPNLPSMVEALAGQGYVVAQEWVPQAAEGDLRVVLWQGAPLDLGAGQPSVYRRVHRPEDFRNNVHAGGGRAPAGLGPAELEIIERLGPALRADGMALVGLDLAGGRVLEVNVHAPGGLHNLHALYGVDAAARLFDALEADGSSHRNSAHPAGR